MSNPRIPIYYKLEFEEAVITESNSKIEVLKDAEINENEVSENARSEYFEEEAEKNSSNNGIEYQEEAEKNNFNCYAKYPLNKYKSIINSISKNKPCNNLNNNPNPNPTRPSIFKRTSTLEVNTSKYIKENTKNTKNIDKIKDKYKKYIIINNIDFKQEVTLTGSLRDIMKRECEFEGDDIKSINNKKIYDILKNISINNYNINFSNIKNNVNIIDNINKIDESINITYNKAVFNVDNNYTILYIPPVSNHNYKFINIIINEFINKNINNLLNKDYNIKSIFEDDSNMFEYMDILILIITLINKLISRKYNNIYNKFFLLLIKNFRRIINFLIFSYNLGLNFFINTQFSDKINEIYNKFEELIEIDNRFILLLFLKNSEENRITIIHMLILLNQHELFNKLLKIAHSIEIIKNDPEKNIKAINLLFIDSNNLNLRDYILLLYYNNDNIINDINNFFMKDMKNIWEKYNIRYNLTKKIDPIYEKYFLYIAHEIKKEKKNLNNNIVNLTQIYNDTGKSINIFNKINTFDGLYDFYLVYNNIVGKTAFLTEVNSKTQSTPFLQ